MKKLINKVTLITMLLGTQPAFAHIGNHGEATNHLFGIEYIVGLIAVVAVAISLVRNKQD